VTLERNCESLWSTSLRSWHTLMQFCLCFSVRRQGTNIVPVCWIWGSHSCGYEGFCLLEYNIVQPSESKPAIWRNILPPSLEFKSMQSTKPASCIMLGSCLAYSLALMMEAVGLLDMLVDFHKTTQHSISKDRTLLSYSLLHIQICHQNSSL
jgi:hypothetical protein